VAGPSAEHLRGHGEGQRDGITEITPPVPSLFNNPCNPDKQAHTLIEMPLVGDSSALTAAKLYTQATSAS